MKPLPITREMANSPMYRAVDRPGDMQVSSMAVLALLDRIDEQEKEIESLKLDIDDLVDRAPSRDDVEYEIEQKAWELWVAKYGTAASKPKYEYGTAASKPKYDEVFHAAERFISHRRRRRRQEKKG